MALLAGRSPAEWTAPDFDLARITAPASVPVSLPSQLIRLSAVLTQEGLNPGDIFKADAAAWTLLGGLTAPVFHGGTLKAERRAAEADARISLARYEQTVLKAFVQVSDVLSNLGSDQQAIEALKMADQAAEDAAADAQNALRLGGGPMMDVVQAQRTLSRARRALVEAQGRRMSDLVELYAATAADWRTAS